MGTWTDHPYSYKGYLWLYKPQLMWSGTLSAVNTRTNGLYGSTDIVERLFYIDEYVGDWAWIKEGMTVALGSTIGGWDYGWARVRGTSTFEADPVILTWTPQHGNATEWGRAGEFYITSPSYISVFNDFRVWAKLPFLDGATGFWDGQNGAGGTVYRQLPVANDGTMRADFVDSGGTKAFDFSGADSFAASPKGYLGQLSASTASSITSSSEVGANVDDNAFDGNPGTYWEASTGVDEWIEWNQTTDPLAIDITAETTAGAPQDFILEVDDIFGVRQELQNISGETGWAIGETRRFYIEAHFDDVFWDSPREVRLTVSATNGSALKIREIEPYYEDRVNTSPYTRDIDDGTYDTGSSTTEEITASFDPGFRYTELSVEDAESSQSGETHTPVLTLTENPTNAEISYAASTPTASTEDGANVAANAFDGSDATRWRATATTGWLKIQLAAAGKLTGYRVGSVGTEAPAAWIVEGSTDDIAWDLLDTQSGQTFSPFTTREYTFYNNVHEYTYWRITVTANNGSGTNLSIYEWDLWLDETNYAPIENFRVAEQRHGQQGQRLSVEIYEDIDWLEYPPGTLGAYIEREYYIADYYQMMTQIQQPALLGQWPLFEDAGAATAEDVSGSGFDGTASNVTFGVTGIGDGNTAASFNGTTSEIDVFSAGLATVFDEDAGTVSAWCKVSGAGIWPDALQHDVFIFYVDGSNFVRIYKPANTSVLRASYVAGGTTDNIDSAQTTTGWLHVAITWDTSADEFKFYVDGTLVGTTTGLGTWAGSLTFARIGLGNGFWSGDIAHVGLWDEALSADDITTLSSINVSRWTAEGSLSAAGPTGRENVKMWGWLDESRERVRGDISGHQISSQITLLDVGQRLAQLPGFPFVIENDYTDVLPAYYNLMDGACIGRLIYLMMRWLSSVAEITDFLPLQNFSLWVFPILEVTGNDLWEMMRGRAEAALMKLGSTKHGAIKINFDYQMQVRYSRPTAQIAIDEDDITNISYSNTPTPRLHWWWASSVLKSWDDPTGGGFTVTAYKAVAPGDAPGQGLRSAEQNEMLVQNLSDFEARVGQFYAYENARFSRLQIDLAHGGDTGLDPGDMQYIALTLSDDYAARRGHTWASEEMWLVEVETRHLEGNTKQVILHVEDYIVGTDADRVT